MIQLNDQIFESNIANEYKILVLVDFWSPRCESCRHNAAVADEILKDLEGKIKVGKVNVDECPYIVSKYNVRIVPSMILFYKGEKFYTFNGIVTKDRVMAVLSENSIA